MPRSAEWFEKYEHAKREIATLITSFGGSIHACMGVGLKYVDYMDLEYSDVALDVMRKIKAKFDPNGIMNPGKKIPAAKH